MVRTLQIVLDDSRYDDFVQFKEEQRIIAGLDKLSWSGLVDLLCKQKKGDD